MALELGVEPRRESTRLQDAIDVDALSELFRAPDPVKSDVLVAFSIWGIRYVVTPTSVTATRED